MSYLIIGYGNPLRGDDGVGWAVVEAMEQNAAAFPHPFTFITYHQLLPELADQLAQASGVIFIDATVNGEPGSIHLTPLSPDTHGPASSHQMGPGVLLAYTQELYGQCPSATLITITGASFGYEEKLTPPIESLVKVVCAEVKRIIYQWDSA